MPYCPSCGSEVLDADAFCQECGEELDRPGGEAGGGPPDGDSGEADEPTAADANRTAESEPSGPDAEAGATITADRLVFAGVAIAALGAFLPWISMEALATSVSVVGIDRDGRFTIAAALIAGLIAWAGNEGRWAKLGSVLVFLLGGFVAFLGGMYIYDPLIGVPPEEFNRPELVQIGTGLYATLIGGALIAAGPVYGRYHSGASDNGGDGSDEGGWESYSTGTKAVLVVIGLLVGGFFVRLLSGG